MLWKHFAGILFSLVTLGGLAAQDDTQKLNEHLTPLKAIVGKTYRGEFAKSTPEMPMIDVSRWERAMNGQAVRITHSVNDGAYGGETIMMWDAKEKKVAYWYFTTAGFFTRGEVNFESDKKWTTVEEVTGNENGITKVRATTVVGDDGGLHVKSEYLAKDQWTPGHDIRYRPSADSKVNFK